MSRDYIKPTPSILKVTVQLGIVSIRKYEYESSITEDERDDNKLLIGEGTVTNIVNEICVWFVLHATVYGRLYVI